MGVLFLCLPFLLLASAVLALNSGMRRLAFFLGLLSATGVIVLALMFWQAYKFGHPTPAHFQDVDRIPPGIGIRDWEPQLGQVAVDHVYYYDDRLLRSTQCFRCHLLHEADFQRYRQAVRERSRGEPKAQTWQTEWATQGIFRSCKEIRAWWDWPNRPDCEAFYFGELWVVVFDHTRNLVYIARSDG